MDTDFLYLIVKRIVAEDAERLICLRHFSSLMQTDENTVGKLFAINLIELILCYGSI